ncbi:MAG: YfiR/HmsC family protein [Campylobacterota bacterium]|nr:YfiR/HmsC family protein [Campylobacterota bacterium]
MKTLILLLVLVGSIFGTTINESLLKVHATLVPKISLMDYKFKEKIKNNTITIAIMYKNNEYKDAKSLKKKIDTRYKNGIKSFKVSSKLVPYSDIAKTEANIYYIFPAEVSTIKKVVKQANKNSALTFSYLKEDLKHGVMISLNVSKKIEPILNLSAIKTHNITFRPVLIDISIIYNETSLLDKLKSKNMNMSYIFLVKLDFIRNNSQGIA